MGGENAVVVGGCFGEDSSSPRGRGKPCPWDGVQVRGGLIPAWAGKTSLHLRYGSLRRAHPRVGGENKESVSVYKTYWGSSPRGRGKLGHPAHAHRPPGLIPAWAGKTSTVRCASSRARAHPRVGGENSCASSVCLLLGGSSPRGRGKRGYSGARYGNRWLIPAWAGKTHSPRGRRQPPRPHPRVGGENSWKLKGKAIVSGSSPRGRGKRGGDDRVHCSVRLIPAWAGKTLTATPGPVDFRVHPRVGGENGGEHGWCPFGGAHPRVGGENGHAGDFDLIALGSSPRGRGKQSSLATVPAHRRLIPAWAGKTSLPMGHHNLRRAHPRVGGENVDECRHRAHDSGSSPRGRGKPGLSARTLRRTRLIPAWAGKTRTA